MTQVPSKTCLVIHGGAMKSALAAGFVYGLSQHGVTAVDAVVGISSSVGTAVAVATGKFEELRSAWCDDLTGNDFVSFKRLFFGKPIFDVDWLLNEIYQKRYGVTVQDLRQSPTTFITCGYNFKTDRIDFWTSKDKDFEMIAWNAMKSAMTIHPDHGTWIHGYRHTDADLALYKLYENLAIGSDYRALIISNHYDQTYTWKKRVGNWIFRFFQSASFPQEVQDALRNRATLQQHGLTLLAEYIQRYHAVLYKPPKSLRVPFWAVLTSHQWLMRYYFDQGEKQAALFVADPKNAALVNALRDRSTQLSMTACVKSSACVSESKMVA